MRVPHFQEDIKFEEGGKKEGFLLAKKCNFFCSLSGFMKIAPKTASEAYFFKVSLNFEVCTAWCERLGKYFFHILKGNAPVVNPNMPTLATVTNWKALNYQLYRIG